MRKLGFNKTRQRILTFIIDFCKKKRYGPTVREIAAALGIGSTGEVQYHLNVLTSEGRISRDPGVSRSIRPALEENAENTVLVPLLGVIAAGQPLPVFTDTWTDEAMEHLELTGDITRGKEVCAFRVSGYSMVDALVDDGDIVLLQPARNIEVGDGDMVAAWLAKEQELTLKRIYREKGRVRLQPANASMQPIYCRPDNVEVWGKVVAVIRKL